MSMHLRFVFIPAVQSIVGVNIFSVLRRKVWSEEVLANFHSRF